jgi:hypothetical protein
MGLPFFYSIDSYCDYCNQKNKLVDLRCQEGINKEADS